MLLDDTEKDIYEPVSHNQLRACIDWLSFTINPSENMSVLHTIKFLGFKIENFIQMHKGANGYLSMLKLNGSSMKILYDGREDMGIHIDVPSSALSDLLYAWKRKNTGMTPFGMNATLYNLFDFNLLLDLLDALSEIATFTRVDLAIDDIGCNYYSCDDIVKLIEQHRLISKFKKYDTRMPRVLSDGTKEGHTIYLGSRKSEAMLRIYDKQLEFTKNHVPEFPYEWIRWEMELKKERANQVIKKLLETHSLSAVCIGILNQYVRFIEPDNPQKTRCSNTPIWNAFIGDMQKMSLYVPKNPKTIEDTKRWIDKYVGASLSAVIEADGGSMEFIYKNLPKWQTRREQNRELSNRLVKTLEKPEKE